MQIKDEEALTYLRKLKGDPNRRLKDKYYRTLFVVVGDYPQQIAKDVTFLVVDYSSAYNAILG